MLQKDRCGGIVDDEQGRVRTEWGRTVRKEAGRNGGNVETRAKQEWWG